MKTEKPLAAQYVDGDARLPRGFTTGYSRDLAIARDMIRLRRAGNVANQAEESVNHAAFEREVA
jgi:hypothetical protein